jgi:hypothetical protein
LEDAEADAAALEGGERAMGECECKRLREKGGRKEVTVRAIRWEQKRHVMLGEV